MRGTTKAAGIIAAATVALIVSSCSTGTPATDDTGAAQGPVTQMNMCNFAGTLGEAIADVAAGFEAEYNVHINWCVGTGTGADNVAKVAASAANQAYDVVMVDNQAQNLGSSQGLWADLDPAIVDQADVYEPLQAKNGDSVPLGMITTNLFYNTEVFDDEGWDPPTSFQDLVDPEYCNQVGIPDISQAHGLTTVLGLGELTAKEAAAGDLDRAFEDGLAKLVDAKECFPTFEPSPGGLEQKAQTGEYVLGTHSSVRILPIIDAGVPLGTLVPSEGAFLTLSFVAPVKGGPNAELAQEFCNWMISQASQETLMNKVYYGPVVSSVTVPQKLVDVGVLTADDIDSLIIPDVATVTAKRPGWTDEYQRALG